ncbi:MAG TPA: nucleotidyltransferase [Candidatus Saccharimonadales bacterium]|nr:nucleotidyltransferase [Candidatus Saccharimonadales bacterium]
MIRSTSWTNVGAQDAAQQTYASVKKAIAAHPALTDKSVEVFLQGSYANSTNVHGDSDVDIVVMSRKTFYSDTDRLSFGEKLAYEQQRVPATYLPKQLRTDIIAALTDYYGASRIEIHKKCIRVLKRDGYVDADVVPAFQYRLYRHFGPLFGHDYIEGTALFPSEGSRIVNYPKEHKKNGSAKNLITLSRYKPTVRQLKNLKRHVVALGQIDPKAVPGYLLECMAYNIPRQLFHEYDHTRLLAVTDWLGSADYTNFESVDGIHTLFGTDPGNFSQSAARDAIKVLARHLS